VAKRKPRQRPFHDFGAFSFALAHVRQTQTRASGKSFEVIPLLTMRPDDRVGETRNGSSRRDPDLIVNADGLGWPMLGGVNDAYTNPSQALEENMRTEAAVEPVHRKPRHMRPLVDALDIVRPDSPSRAVIEFDDAVVMALANAHSSPLSAKLVPPKVQEGPELGGSGVWLGHFSGKQATPERPHRLRLRRNLDERTVMEHSPVCGADSQRRDSPTIV